MDENKFIIFSEKGNDDSAIIYFKDNLEPKKFADVLVKEIGNSVAYDGFDIDSVINNIAFFYGAGEDSVSTEDIFNDSYELKYGDTIYYIDISGDTDTSATMNELLANLLNIAYDNGTTFNDLIEKLTQEGFNVEVKEKIKRIKSINETNYGYKNNATMYYGELDDGNWYVYIFDNDYLSIFDEPITNKFIDTAYNYQTDDEKADDEWYDNFIKEHEVTKNYDDNVLREITADLDDVYEGYKDVNSIIVKNESKELLDIDNVEKSDI